MALGRLCTAALMLVVATLVAACSTPMTAMMSSAGQMVPFGRAPDQVPPLDPKFQYLRITRDRHTGWMWLGSTEKSAGGPVEVYYSGQGEVLRLQNGRIVGASGLTTEWRGVVVEAPSWAAAAAGGQATAVNIFRTRDVMPGYRTGVRDELLLSAIAPPGKSALRAVDAGKLAWFEERFQAATGAKFLFGGPEPLPPARYAVDLSLAGGQVLYAEQCLAQDLCFSWQRWSAAMQAASAQ